MINDEYYTHTEGAVFIIYHSYFIIIIKTLRLSFCLQYYISSKKASDYQTL